MTWWEVFGGFSRTLIIMTLAGSAAALILFALKPLVRDRLPKSTQYYMWLLVVAAYLVPISTIVVIPARTVAVPTISAIVRETVVTGYEYQEREMIRRTGHAAQMSEEQIARMDDSDLARAADVIAETEHAKTILNFALLHLPLIGIFAVLFAILATYARFVRKLSKRNSDARANELATLAELSNTRVPRLCRNPLAATPMLIGVFRPTIVLPDREYTDAQLRSVLLHELTHLRRKDALVKWLSVLVCAVHWFNPVAWLVRRELDHACELSCDEAVIRDLDADGKQNYGETLISVAADSRTLPRAVLSTTMCEEKKALKERLGAIMKNRKHTKIAVALSAALVIAVAAVAVILGVGSNGAAHSAGANDAGSEIVLTVDGHDFQKPWYTVYRNGKAEYYPRTKEWNPNGYESYVFPHVDDADALDMGISKCVIRNNTAYLEFFYYGILDTYVYDIENKTGRWMSGADNLADFYKAEIAEVRRLNEGIEGAYRGYRNFNIVTISRDGAYALIRRTEPLGELSGKYLMRNLATGEETYICGSYTRKNFISFMDEYAEWLDDDHLQVHSVIDSDPGWQGNYDVVFDGRNWVVNSYETDRVVGLDNVFDFSDENESPGAIDIYNLIDYMHKLIPYVKGSVANARDAKKLDLLYFAAGQSFYDMKVTNLYVNQFTPETGPLYSASAAVISEYLHDCFNLGPDSLDKYKSGSYDFISIYDYYDAVEETFYFRYPLLSYDEDPMSVPDTVIHIDGSDITIKTLLKPQSDGIASKNATYKLRAQVYDGKLYYTLVSAEIK